MRSAKLIDIGKIEVVDVPAPVISRDTDVLVEVRAVGICGTDLHIFREGRADVQLPRIMGHELSGVVKETGSAVSRLEVGDRVVLDPVFACGSCATCQKGYPNICNHVRCFGVQMDGGYQDYIVVDESHLHAFDSSISYETAALAEPFSIAANILERTYLAAGETLLVIGSGTIGLAVAQAAKALGARVMVADIVSKKLQLAAEMGVDCTVNSREASIAQAAELFAPGGFEVIVDAVGITPLFMQALELAAPRTRIACIGFDSRPAEIPLAAVTKKELSIIGSRMNCNRFPVVVDWLNSGRIAADKMISKKYNILDIQRAFEETLADGEGSVKTLILFD